MQRPVMENVVSSNIAQVGYSEKTSELFVRFHGSGTYRYSGVESNVFDNMKMASSIGKFFHAAIKGKYESEYAGL